jgi:3-deoxy-D-glycero-D-galacto-nononate 9-phosphate synthase
MNSVYIIGEIGQNHNGSVDLAKLMIDVVSRSVVDKFSGATFVGINAVKLTKRDLSEELSKSQMSKEYRSIHSFGATYGEHRAYLELNNDEHHELYKYAKLYNIDFIETLCSKGTFSLLKLFTPDKIKVASRDLTNIPLLSAIAETKLPIILSTGMVGKRELDEAIEVITRQHSFISILHCVSEYPTQYKNVNLNTIRYLKKEYSEYVIGFSDHTIGIATPLAAVALGAEIIEKHITIDRKMKGTDQLGSLAIDGIARMVRDIRNLELSLGIEDIFVCDDVKSAKEKLERSIASIKKLKKGHSIKDSDIHMLSPGDGYSWSDRNMLIGKKLAVDVSENEIIYSKYLLK